MTDLRFLPLVIAGLGVVAGLFLLRRYLSARRDERRLRLGSPLWLIPRQDNPEDNPDASLADEVMNRFNYALDYEEQARAETLQRQVRRLAIGLAATGAATLLSLGWFVVGERMGPSQPTFVSQEIAKPTTDAPAQAADSTPPAADLPMVALQKQPAHEVPTGTTGAERPARQQPLAQAAVPAPATQPPPAAAATLSADTTAAVKPQPLVVVTPPPPPAATPATPTPDPAALSRAAAAVLQRGAVQAVAAINRADVAELRDRNGSSGGWSAEMLRSVQELKPVVTIGDVAAPVLTGTTVETRFPVTFRWRGNFGVNRIKTISFAATARLEGDRWVLVAVRPLEKFP